MDRALESLVWERANGRCEYRRIAASDVDLPFEIDHVIAEQHRGPTDSTNLCLACFSCNRHKGPNIAGVDPASGRIVPLFHPRRQNWRRYFVLRARSWWDGRRAGGRPSRFWPSISTFGSISVAA